MNDLYDRYAVPPDREFAASLKAELDARLYAPQQSATHNEMESELMIFKPDGTGPRRPWILVVAAALITIVGVGAIAVIAARDTATPAPADQPSSPTTVAPTSTTAAPTTTVASLNDEEIANSTLLRAGEFVSGWDFGGGAPFSMDGNVAAGLPACAPYVDTVFESPARPAVTDWQGFTLPPGPAFSVQYVVVLPTEAEAIDMMTAIKEPAFLHDCLPAYWATFHNTTPTTYIPMVEGVDSEPPTLNIPADDMWVRAYDGTVNEVPNYSRFVSATLRVGRVVTIMEGYLSTSTGDTVMTLDDYAAAMARVVDRARNALAGTPQP